MNLRVRVAPFAVPQGEYNRDTLNQFVRSFNELLNNYYNPGDIVGASLQIIDAAQTGYGLPVGGVYVDANGFLKIVRTGEAFAPSFGLRTHLGTVTVAIT